MTKGHLLGLGNGAREAVEDEAVLAGGLGQVVLDQVYNKFVGDELAGLHKLVGLLAQRRARLDGRAKHVTSGQMANWLSLMRKEHTPTLSHNGTSKLFHELGSLGALARARRAHEDDAGLVVRHLSPRVFNVAQGTGESYLNLT